ncbi:MAG: FtsX-like permease family protein [Cyclobacteriaceae bacterium]|nr:FtsX-like permease family protein [Cyclobacteriaceae bacterium]
MIIKIAWKNIWRSRARSFVVIGSIVLGVWALLVATGFMNGFMVSYMADIINHDISNAQVHNPVFKKDFDIKFYIPNGAKKAATLRKWPEIKATTTRTIINGMIASPKKATGVQIRGIDVENEVKVTQLNSLIKDGAYFEGIKRNPIVIGSKLAEELKVKVRSKVVVTFTNNEGMITSGAFRIVGIVKSSSLKINELYAFVRQEDLAKISGIGNQVHEIGILAQPQVSEASIISKYEELYKEDKIETWREIAPELAFMQSIYSQMLYVLMVIIMSALVFGIINTMLMAVLERFRELGMLMAVGMNRVKVYLMILIETVFLGVVAAPLGLLIGWLTISYYSHAGVDLTNYSEGLESFGYSSILYPYLDDNVYVIVTISVFVTAIIGALYPAWKAVKLNPVEALHKL